MAFNGSGVWSYTTTSVVPDAAPNTTIDSDDFDTFTAETIAGFNACLPRNGEVPMSGNLTISKSAAVLNVDSTNGGSPAYLALTNDADDTGFVAKLNADESMGLYRSDGAGTGSLSAIFTTGTADQHITAAGNITASGGTIRATAANAATLRAYSTGTGNPAYLLAENSTDGDGVLVAINASGQVVFARTDGAGDATGLTIFSTGASDQNVTFAGTVKVGGETVYGLVVLDTPVEVVSSTATAGVAQTALDLTTARSAIGSNVAVKAILKTTVTGTASSGSLTATVRIGEGDETLSAVHNACIGIYDTNTGAGSSETTVNLATGEICDYSITYSAVPATTTVKIYLVGYYVTG